MKNELTDTQKKFLETNSNPNTETCETLQLFKTAYPDANVSSQFIRNKICQAKSAKNRDRFLANIEKKQHTQNTKDKYSEARSFTTEQYEVLTQNTSQLNILKEWGKRFPKDTIPSLREFAKWINVAKYRTEKRKELEQKQKLQHCESIVSKISNPKSPHPSDSLPDCGVQLASLINQSALQTQILQGIADSMSSMLHTLNKIQEVLLLTNIEIEKMDTRFKTAEEYQKQRLEESRKPKEGVSMTTNFKVP